MTGLPEALTHPIHLRLLRLLAAHRFATTTQLDTEPDCWRTYLGADQRRTGVFPLVVWVVPHTRRRRRLQGAIARDAALNPRLFRVITPDQLPALIHDGPDALPPPAAPAT